MAGKPKSTLSNFGNRQAAPFAKHGGRDNRAANDARGNPKPKPKSPRKK